MKGTTFTKIQQIKPPKTGGILENQPEEQKEIVLPITSQVLPIMLLTIIGINCFRLIKKKK